MFLGKVAKTRARTAQVTRGNLICHSTFSQLCISHAIFSLPGDLMPLGPKEEHGRPTSDPGCRCEQWTLSRSQIWQTEERIWWTKHQQGEKRRDVCPTISTSSSGKNLEPPVVVMPVIFHLSANGFPRSLPDSAFDSYNQGQELCMKVHPAWSRVGLTKKRKVRD